MNDKVKQIFEILGLEPEEEFKINGWDIHYKFDCSLKLFFMSDSNKWWPSAYTIADIIHYGIIKTPQEPKLSNKDKISIKFLKNCGFHYVAREKNGKLYTYSYKPYKSDNCWVIKSNQSPKTQCFSSKGMFEIFDLKISWTDAEPLCLDDFSDEDLKED